MFGRGLTLESKLCNCNFPRDWPVSVESIDEGDIDCLTTRERNYLLVSRQVKS